MDDELETVFPLPLWFVIVATILFSCGGCAEDRWLTKEEDAEMRAACEPVGGCAVIPNPVWKQIKRALGMDDA